MKHDNYDFLDNLIKETDAKFLSKEIDLFSFDNYILDLFRFRYGIANVDGLFCNYKLAVEKARWGYYIPNTGNGINVIWKLVKESSNCFNTIVKVIAIERAEH